MVTICKAKGLPRIGSSPHVLTMPKPALGRSMTRLRSANHSAAPGRPLVERKLTRTARILSPLALFAVSVADPCSMIEWKSGRSPSGMLSSSEL